MKQVNKKQQEVIFIILSRVVPFNFNSYLDKSDDQGTLKREKIVIVVDNVCEIAKDAGYDLCRYNNNAFIYNGEYWVQIEDTTLSSFLGEASKNMGVDTIESRHHEFRDSLMKQFRSVASRTKNVKNREEVKINLLNGTLLLGKDGAEMKPFSANDFLTYQLPFAYDKDAKAPIFSQFLDKVLPDIETQKIMAEYIGYVFIPNSTMKLEKGLILVGEGANGKSAYYDIINGLLGRENVSTFSMTKLTDSNGYYRSMIDNVLLNYASEISPKMDTTIFKQLISGEAVEARLPHGKPMIIEDYARFIFNTNELPRDVEHNHAFFRRFLIVPFKVTIPEHEQDKDLAKKITTAELPGVLNWALEGLDRLINQGGFTQSSIVDEVVSRFKKESDTVYLFLEDNDYWPDPDNELTLKDIFNSYKSYCSENLYKPVGNKTFKKRLEHHGYLCRKTNVGIKVNAIVTTVIEDSATIQYSLN
ncbi:MAG: DNA primase [Bacteroidetes bacterium]|nr:DNA primase [Bacteroidota bacterium]